VNRRRFLRGLGGVVVGLPLLESLGYTRFMSSSAQAQSTGQPIRFVTFFQCNGANMSKFWPTGGYGALTPAHFAADRTLFPLLNHREKLLLVRNMHTAPKGFGWDSNTGGDDHQKGVGHKLTAAPLDGSNFAQGISLDQFIAKQLNPSGRAPMNLGVHRVGGGGTGSISYRGPGQPVTSENNPRLVFQDLMGIRYNSATSSEPARDLSTERRKSVIDLVQADFESLRVKRLSKGDQQKLDMHLTTIRDLEMQLGAGAMGMGTSGCVPLSEARAAEIRAADRGTNITDDAQFKKLGRMQMDLMALALACDHTRVATLQWGSGAGGPTFKWDGMNHTYNHHKLSHGLDNDGSTGNAVAGYEDMLYNIDRWFAGEFAYLLDKLKGYSEPGGTLLDNSVALWINELSDGKAHDFRDIPCVIAGGGGGKLKQGHYVNVSKVPNALNAYIPDLDAPHNKLLTTIANVVGAKDSDGGPVKRFGHPSYGGAGEFTQLRV
jgi:hypothetical protein